MDAERAVRALFALKRLSNLMDLWDEFDEEEPRNNKRKVYVKSEDIESQILKDIAWKNTDNDDSFCPMTMDNFEELCTMISATVNKHALVMPSLSLRMRVAITLRYLISGDSHRKLEAISHISRKYTPRIIPEMLRVLIDILEQDHIKLPKKKNEWINGATDFEVYWDFPHTLGALDIRNFHVKSSVNSESNTLILLSCLDAHSRFQHIEIIQTEEAKHPSAYVNSSLYKSLITKKLDVPPETPLEGQASKTAYFFIANENFHLDRHTLTAYNDNISTITRSQKAFNFRLNRALLPVQMAFEILFFRFKIFHRLNEIHIDKAKLAIKACCLLHNFFTQKLTQRFEYNEESGKLELSGSDVPLPKQITNSPETETKTRDNMTKYCVNEGNLAEQWQKII